MTMESSFKSLTLADVITIHFLVNATVMTIFLIIYLVTDR
jgi:hypothetical protein